MLNTLNPERKGVSTLEKPDKVYLENTNLAYALKSSLDIGNIRETFVFNQLYNAGLNVYSPKAGDFVFDGYTLEIGGKIKNTSQVKHLDNYLYLMILKQELDIKLPSGCLGFCVR